MKSTHIHIGDNILSVMYDKGVTKAKLARLLEISPQSVDYLLKRKSIDMEDIVKLNLKSRVIQVFDKS
ncbi:hypothetical protein FACS189421_06190 [Bacteroidia bacterium]|nr:hypothetical protein FACS189421_06190 [Bacteroidia bacterium]GHT03396.1 hypothetical protein FACS189423_04200 [Bacteroidia bacterium]GHT45155.1 hypothetical protein FACS189440_00590 [Bacteroidia bacterium]